jgi:Zn-dependent protease with chaperone function
MSLFYDGTEKLLFGLLPFLPRLYVSVLHSFLIGGYAASILILLLSIIKKNIIESKGTYVHLRKSLDEYNKEQKIITKIITPICEYFNISIPQIIIINSGSINAQAKFMIYPYCKTAITITKGAVDKLNKFELNALVAHEASHLANGIKMQKFLYIMSDITFCGSAFLNILQNSFSLELKADDDAFEWLKNNNIPYKYIISLLEKKNIDQAMSYIFINGLSFQGMSASKKNINNEYYNKTFLQRRKIDIKIFTQIYFNQSIISYIHPSNEFRINRINKIAEKD